MEESRPLTISEFMGYKAKNTAIPDELQKQLDTLKQPQKRQFRQLNQSNQPRHLKSWAAAQASNEENVVYSQFVNSLNKISDSNFDEIAKEIKNIKIESKEQLEKLAELILLKASSERNFSKTYAKLTKILGDLSIGQGKEKISFRVLLLHNCQKMFLESISHDKDDNNAQGLKNLVLGCMQFIGELYNDGLLTDDIIGFCFAQIINRISLNKAYGIDCLCTLIKIVGKIYFEKCPMDAQTWMDKMTIIQGQKIEMKDKFAIMDIFEIRKKERW